MRTFSTRISKALGPKKEPGISEDGEEMIDVAHLSLASTASTTTGGHSYVNVTTEGSTCGMCSGEISTGDLGAGVTCTGCGLTLHEACRGMSRRMVCAKPRSSSLRVLEVESAPPSRGPGGKLLPAAPGTSEGPAVSSPRGLLRVQHVSFRKETGMFSGLQDTDINLFFGAPMTGQPRVALVGYADRVPYILVLLAQELVKRNGLEQEGIFRVSAESHALEHARDLLNIGRGVPALGKDVSPNVFACLIKDWFRSLPAGNSLLGGLDTEVLATFAKAETMDKDSMWTTLLTSDLYLSEPNRSIFTWTLDLMALVVAQEAKNRMTGRALAIVFAPSLWEAPTDMAPMKAMNAVKDVSSFILGALEFVRRSQQSASRKPIPDKV